MENYQQPEPPEDDRGHGNNDARRPAGRIIESAETPEPGFRPDEVECEPPQPSDHELLSALEVRMHFPEGGVPKEGPSAGIAVATALLSALMQIPIRPRIALTGEITLTGQVLPVGGLKEKMLAALREGVHTVVLPRTVAPEIHELPVELKKGLEIVYVDTFLDVLPHVLDGIAEREGTGQA
jgi:ATP-dependent Lon protease